MKKRSKINPELLKEAYPIIEKLSSSRSRNGAFAYYENKDVSQEIWCMCLEALANYDPSIGPIENFLVTHTTNRLKNLKRDKYFRPGTDAVGSGLANIRINLVNALPINEDQVSFSPEPLGMIAHEETIEYIREKLPDELKESFDQLLGKNKINKVSLTQIRHLVLNILAEMNDHG